MSFRFTILLSAVLCLFGCDADIITEDYLDEQLYSLEIVPFQEVIYPEDNEFSEERVRLGEKLFFDPILSRDYSISCASCHKPESAFSDQIPTSPGVENRPGKRNAPPLWNVAFHPYFTREGGVPSLEQHVLVPFQEENEFDLNILHAQDRLAKIPEYVADEHKSLWTRT